MDDRIHRYSDSDRPSMGYFDVPKPQNQQKRRIDRSTEPSYPRVSKQGGQREITGLYRHQEPQATMRFSEQGRRDLEQWQSNGSNGVLNYDRVRRHLLEALEQAQAQQQQKEADLQKMFERTRQDNQSVKEAFKSLLESISATDQTQKRTLEQISTACEQLERSATGLQDTKRNLDQAIASARNASTQAKEMNEPQLRAVAEFPYEIIENYFYIRIDINHIC